MSLIICPFCSKIHDFSSGSECPEYQEVVPLTYVRNYSEVEPLRLAVVGFLGHGKTTYLAALTRALEDSSKSACNANHTPVLPSRSLQQVRSFTSAPDLKAGQEFAQDNRPIRELSQ